MFDWAWLFVAVKPVTFGQLIRIIDRKAIDDEYAVLMFDIAKKFHEKTGEMPGKEDWIFLFTGSSEKEEKKAKCLEILGELYSKEPINEAVFVEQLLEKVRQVLLVMELKKTVAGLDRGVTDIEGHADRVKALERIKLERPKMIDVRTNIDIALKRLREYSSKKMTTGLPDLDFALGGGWDRKEVEIIIAPPGRGKSMLLLNHAVSASLKYDVLLVTLELDDEAYYDRFLRRVTRKTRKQIKENEKEARELLEKFYAGKESRFLIHYEPAQTFSCADLEGLLEKLAVEENFKPAMVVIDYLKEMSPRKSDYNQNLRVQLSNICEDLRNIAIKRDVAILTAMQTTKESLDKKVITVKDIAESFAIAHVAGIVLAYCQTKEEYEAKQARYFVAKDRENESYQQIALSFDFSIMEIRGLDNAVGESGGEGIEDKNFGGVRF